MDGKTNFEKSNIDDECSKQLIDITISEGLCIKCGTCVMACPHDVLIQNKDNVPKINTATNCISCGHCTAVCKVEAINHPRLKNKIKPVDKTIYPVIDQVLCLIQSRRSIRAFEEKIVEKELVELIISGAAAGPTSSNSQNIEYTIVQDQLIIDKIITILEDYYRKLVCLLKSPEILCKLPEAVQDKTMEIQPLLPTFERIIKRINSGNDILNRGTPTLLIAHASEKPFDWPIVNASIALYNASLVCSASGLGSCQLGYVEIMMDNNSQIQEMLGIPEDHATYGVMVFGYPSYTFDNWIEKEQINVTWR